MMFYQTRHLGLGNAFTLSIYVHTSEIIFLKIFLCGPFLKPLMNLLQYDFCFMVWLFVCKAHGILPPQSGIKTILPALKSEVLSTGPPGKSQHIGNS